MIVTPAPTTPYHRLARTAAHRWWKPLVGTGLVLIFWILAALTTVFAGSVALAAATGTLDQAGEPSVSGPVELAGVLVAIALATPAVLLAARWVQRRPAGTVSSVLGRLRYRWLGTCLAVAFPASVLMVLGGWALLAATGRPLFADSGTWVGWGPFAAGMALIVALVPLQASAEEYLCRGWLLQAVGAFWRTPWPAVGVQALVFAAAHGWAGGATGFAFFALFGVVTGVLAVRTGGLEAGIAMHVSNNVLAFGLTAATGPLGVPDQASLPWQEMVVCAVLLAGYAAVVLRIARRRRVETAVPAPDGVPSGTAWTVTGPVAA
jgi:membrane protease YdiL (CAAX protease family)